MQINDGAVATNNRNVTLNLEATDPLIGGISGHLERGDAVRDRRRRQRHLPVRFFFGPEPRTSADAPSAFNPATPATLPAGDGVKTVGVKFGDGARVNTAPCPPFCAILLGSPILGNESAIATDTILLDTVKPNAVVKQDRTTVNRGDQVNFDAGSSADQASVATSGIDLPTAVWQWKDGTPNTTGAKVSHVFNQSGTFVGELRVKDRAGNTSDPRSFTVTVNAPGGGASGGSISGLTGKAAFKLNRLKVKSRFVTGRLTGSIMPQGVDRDQRHHDPQGRPAPRPAPDREGAAGGQDPGQEAEGRGVHADAEAAGEPEARHLQAGLRRPGRDAALHAQAHAVRAGGPRAVRGRSPRR